ncbi:hypothetical protein [Salinicola tamaricis]|uniref:hypothetical protein n=1 Tax=Salinicola tamaricis TaxID=1771309 RepID=UPI001F5CE00E|nr:hypothetical protein [Salinicola tamaricis]
MNKEGKTVHGGTCLNVGCIPSKALLETSHKFVETRDHYAEIGINVGDVATDVKKMMGVQEQRHRQEHRRYQHAVQVQRRHRAGRYRQAARR